jgi:3,4-dihydroxy 2-butanone 4-phosphate synthase/GTP cyclohydrolase II
LIPAKQKKEQQAMSVSKIEDLLEDIRQGRMVILVDDEDRENEGDLTMAAEKVTPEAINFMATHGRGLICLSLEPEKVDQIGLPPMVRENTSSFGTAFTVSIEARRGITTGISAADRATTILAAIDPDCAPDDLARPGHVFPLRAAKGGVLKRAGQTEGSVDLARMAGLVPAGVICEIMNEDGTMARMPDLVKFADMHGLKIGTIADMIKYRMRNDSLIRRAAETVLPTGPYGEFKAIIYENDVDSQHHLALVKGQFEAEDHVLVRVHSECLTGDVFGSHRCDCGEQLQRALEIISKEGAGVLLYMRQEGRGIGLLNKLKAYELQDRGMDTVQANVSLGFKPDLRDYGIGAQILADLGLHHLRLMTNNPKKIVGLGGYGLDVVERVPLETSPREGNEQYLKTKRDKMGHLIGNLHEYGSPSE